MFKCTTKLNLNKRRDLPLGNPVVDAEDLRPDACLAKYSGVAAARHFALGFFLLVQIAPAATTFERSGRAHGRRPHHGSSKWWAPHLWRRRKVAGVGA